MWCRCRVVVSLALAMTCACGDGNNDHRDGATPSPAVPTPAATACPDRATYSVVGAESNLDLGLTGNHYDVRFSDRASLTLALECGLPGAEGCTACAVSGLAPSTTDVDNRRCAAATHVPCTADSDCPAGACSYFFGPPTPQAIAGIFVCLVQRIDGANGSVSPATGASDVHLDATWSFFVPLLLEQPCPVCSGSDVGQQGTCLGGDRDGLPCTVHATDAVLGNTSLDCPPHAAAPLGSHDLDLRLTTGTAVLDATDSCIEESFRDLPCYCAEQQRPNGCLDASCMADAGGEGTCVGGPVDGLCHLEPFRGCLADDDCPAPGDHCTERPRPCLGPTDAQGRPLGPITREGVADPSVPVLAAAFCVPAGPVTAINEGIGFPGPAAARLPTETCFERNCSF